MSGKHVIAGLTALTVAVCVPSAAAQELTGGMTGGGVVDVVAGLGVVEVKHGFELYCDPINTPNNLEVSWEDQTAHLETVLTSFCENDPDFESENPEADIDTLTLSGTGVLQGSGRTVSITVAFTDGGEPQEDSATFVVKDAGGDFLLLATGRLKGGNHQAHELNVTP
jgi:hypothetical protein